MRMVRRTHAAASPVGALRPLQRSTCPRVLPWGAALVLFLGLSLAAQAGVTLTSNAPGNEAAVGQLFYVTFTLTNSSSQTISAMHPQVDLANASAFVYQAGSATITVDGTVLASQEPTLAGSILTWDLDALYNPDPTLAAGKTATVVFAVRATCDAVTEQFASDTVLTLSGDGVRTWTGLYTLTVQPPALSVALTPSSQTVALSSGANVSWTATIKNVGLGSALNVNAKFGFDAGLLYQTGSAMVGTISDSGGGTSTAGTSPYGNALTIYTWNLGTDMSSDPDGGGGLSDQDGDGQFDDLAANAEVTLTGITAQTQNCEPVGLFLDATCGYTGYDCASTLTDGSTAFGSVIVAPATPDITYAFSGLTGFDYCLGGKDATFTVTNPPASSAAARNLSFALGGFPTGLDFVYPDSQGGAGTGLHTVLYDWDGTTATNPVVLTGANAVTFTRATGVFANFPVIDKGKRLVLTFDVDCLTGANAYCSEDPLDTTVTVQPSYTDVCGDGYSPSSSSTAIIRTTPQRLALATVNSGTDEVYIGDTGRTYDVSATVYALAGNPWSHLTGKMPVTLTYVYDQALVYTGYSNAAGLFTAPVDNPATRTLTWTNVTFSQGSPTFSGRLIFNVTDRGSNPCEAGREYTNSLNVPVLTLTDCLGCNYTIGGATVFRGYINQEVDYIGTPIDAMDKQVTYINTLAGSQGEVHRPYRTTVTVDFGTGATVPATWSGIITAPQPQTPASVPYTEVVLIERPTYGQVFRALQSVKVNGVDYGPAGTGAITVANVTTYLNGEVWLFLGGLDAAGAPKPNAGNVLEVIWDFDPPVAFGTNAQFSEIRWPLATSLCGTEYGYESGCWMYIGNQDLTLRITAPYYVRHSVVSTHSFLLRRTNSAHFAYDPIVTLNLDPDSNGKDYAYRASTTVFSGFVDQAGTPIAAFEPTVVGNTLVWDFRAHGYRVLRSVGSISVDLLTSPCEASPSYTLDVQYNRYLGYEADPSGTLARTVSLAQAAATPYEYWPNLRVGVTPTSRAATRHEDLWLVRFQNTGNAPAWNVGLTATVGTSIEVEGAKLMAGADWNYSNGTQIAPSGVVAGGSISWIFQGAGYTTDPDGADGLSDADGDGVYDDLAAGAAVYILFKLHYVSCASAGMTLGVVAEGGGELPPADVYTTPVVATRPASFCEAGSGSGGVSEATARIQTVHIDPDVELCASRGLKLRVKSVRDVTVYRPHFREFLPKASESGMIIDQTGATYDLDLDGDGTYETIGAPLPAPTVTLGAAGQPDQYEWSYAQFGSTFDDGFSFGAVIDINMRVWANCLATQRTFVFGSELGYTSLCGDLRTTTRFNTKVRVLDLVGTLTVEARNITANPDPLAPFVATTVYGGTGDQIEYRITIKNDGGAVIRNADLDVALPENFATVSIPSTPAWSSRVGNVLTWLEGQMMPTGLDPAAETQVSFVATLDGTTICVNRDASVELSVGCLEDGPISHCDLTSTIETHPLVTAPTMALPELAISATDLVTGDGDSDNIDTNGVVTLEVTGKAGNASRLLLTPTIPSGWSWDGTPTPAFTYTPNTPAAAYASIDGCTVDVTDPVHPVFAFTRGGVPANSILRDGEKVSVRFYIVQDSSFDILTTPLESPETEAGSGDPAVPADISLTAVLAFIDSCPVDSPVTQTVSVTQALVVDTPDLDLDIIDDNPGTVGQLGDVLLPTVEVTNNGENSCAGNGVLTVTVGNAWATDPPADFVRPQTFPAAQYQWTLYAGNTYYVEALGGGDPGLFEPIGVSNGATLLSAGTGKGTLAAGQWVWDSAGTFRTVYVHLGGAVPDATPLSVSAVGTQTFAATLYEWVNVPATDTFYLRKLGGGDPGVVVPETVSNGGTLLGQNAPAALVADQWGWGDISSLGFNTIYVNLGNTLGVPNVPDATPLSIAAALSFGVTKPPTLANTRVLWVDLPCLAMGDTVSFPFTVALTDTAKVFNTFSAHVEAPILHQSGTTTGSNYSFDDRVAGFIGFQQTKVRVSTTEAGSSNPDALIGEEITYKITATWFGGDGTDVTAIVVTDLLPAGQGYLSHTVTTGAGYASVASTTTPTQLSSGGTLTWNLSPFASSIATVVFEAFVTTRVLNAPNDSEGAPNQNGAFSRDTANATFTYGGYDFDDTVPGFPSLAERQVALTIKTPALAATKAVRNVTRSKAFGDADADVGQAGDTFEYRLTVNNPAGRAPAYNVVVTDTLPAKLNLASLAGDSIDNDGDALTDGADSVNGEGSVIGAGPGGQTISFTESHNAALAAAPAGTTLTFLYRAVADNGVYPSESLPNSVTVTADTLPGATGSQTSPSGATGSDTGARVYTTTAATPVHIEEVDAAASKLVIATSRLGAIAPTAGPVDVVVGEEVTFELRFTVYPSTLTLWTLADVLPPGMKVISGSAATLPVAFAPGGSFTPVISTTTHTNDTITWNFTPGGGGPTSQLLAPLQPAQVVVATFIAQVINVSGNQDAVTLTNDGAVTRHDVVTVPLTEAAVTVREPTVVLTKALTPSSGMDAGDVLTVTVTAENTSATAIAYNVDIFDDLTGRDLTYTGNVTNVSGPGAPTAYTSDPGLDPALPTTPAANRPLFRYLSIPASTTYSFSFTVVVATSAQPQRILANTLRGAWTSLQDSTVKLRPGALGAGGTEEGWRNGQIPPDADLNDYEASASAQTSALPAVTAAKADLGLAAGFPAATIGARKQFRVTINLPEGTNNALTVTDVLSTGVTSWVLESDPSYPVTYTLTDIASINGVADLSTNAKIAAALTAAPADESTGTVVWTMGTVVTGTENDTPGGGTLTPKVVIDYYVRIANNATTDAGDALRNAATVSYTHGQTGLPVTLGPYSPPATTVLEPQVTTTKRGRNITKGQGSYAATLTAPDNGDVLEYQVTLTNASGNASTAYDVNLVDTVTTYVTYDATFTPTATLNGAAWSPAVDTTALVAGTTLTWGRGNADLTIDIQTGQTFVIVYRVTVNDTVADGAVLGNTATADWRSLDSDPAPGSATSGRDGNGTNPPNDYTAASSATATADLIYSLSKAISTTADPNTSGTDLTIGETATFLLTASFGEGTTSLATVVDNAPTSPGVLSIESATVVSIGGVSTNGVKTGGTLTVTGLAVGDAATLANLAGADSYNDRATFDFGTVLNTSTDGTVTAADQIVVQVVARLVNIAANQENETSTNNGGVYSGATSVASATQTVHSVEPALGMTKTLVTAAVDAGDVVVYDLAISNTGSATAYDLVVTDTLEANLELVATYADKVVLQVPPAGNYATLVTTANTAAAVNASLSELRVGHSATLRITARAKATTPALQTIGNTADLTYTSLSGAVSGERTGAGGVDSYRATASSSTFTLAQPNLDKSFRNALVGDSTSVASSADANVVIGEQVTSDILVSLPEGVTRNLVVTDTVPIGMRLDGYSIVTTAATSTRLSTDFDGSFTNSPPTLNRTLPYTAASGQQNVTFACGDTTVTATGATTGNAFVVRVVLTVLNQAGVIAGTTFTNAAALIFTNPNDSSTVSRLDTDAGNDPTVTVVEPALSVTKTVAPLTAIDAGDTVTYTVTISNTGAEVAYDVALSDAIPATITGPVILGAADFSATGFYESSVVAASTVDVDGFDTGSFSGAPATLDGVGLVDGNRVLLKDQADPEENGIYVVDDAALGNWSRAADFDQAAEMVAGYRVRSQGGLTQAGFVYRLTATVATPNVDPVTWLLLANYVAPTAADFVITGGTLQVNPASTLNLPPGSAVALKVRGVVAASYQPSQVITNTAAIQWTSTPGANADERTGTGGTNDYTASDSVSTTASVMSAAKSFFRTDQTETAGSNVTLGETVTYALKVTLPEGTTPDLTVVDILPAGLLYDSYQIVTSAAASQDAGGTYLLTADFAGAIPVPAVTGGVANGDDVTFTFGSLSVSGDNDATTDSFLLLVTARVLDVVGNAGLNPPGQTTLANSATFDIAGDTETMLTSGTVNVTVVEPRLTITKAMVPANADARDTVTVALTVENTGTSPAFDVVVEDTLSTYFDRTTVDTGTQGTDYPADFTPSYAPATGLLVYSGGTIPNGESRTLTFTVNLADDVPTGQLVDNTAYVTQATTLQGVVPGERDEPDVSGSDDLTIYTHGFSGYVYRDADNDGVKDGGEAPIAGVTITLTGTNHLGNAVSLTTTTDASGYYEFIGLRPSDASGYTLTETQPAGFLDGKETSGTPWAGTVDNTSVADSQTIRAIVIPKSSASSPSGADYSFGELLANSLAGTVYNDLNDSSAFNSGVDWAIYGATVTLTGTDDRGNAVSLYIGPVTTAADGSYTFPGLRPGTYILTETQPDGYADSSDTVGSIGGTLGNDVISAMALTQSQDGTGYNFGEVGPGKIGDRVFIDLNDNDVYDAGEGIGHETAGVPDGVTIQLVGDLNGDGTTEAITTRTDAAGQYHFDHLPAPTLGRQYLVTVLSGVAPELTPTVDPNSGNAGASRVTLTYGAPEEWVQDFGYQGDGEIGDRVFADINGNGTYDLDEGIPDITVTLVGDVDGDGTIETVPVSTDASGLYQFDWLRTTVAGVAYTVTVDTADAQFPAWLTTNPVDPDGGGNSTAAVSLDDDAPSNLDQDFGYRGASQIGDTVFADWNNNGVFDTVFVDANGNGVFDPGEGAPGLGEGLSGITVTLVGDWDGDGTDETSTTVTDANGHYLFAGLRRTVAGVPYRVTVDSADPQFLVGLTVNHVDPDGGGDSTAVVVLDTVTASNLDQDFGYRGVSVISGRTLRDAGTLGAFDINDLAWGGVTVQLVLDLNGNGVADSGEPVVATQISSVTGAYSFTGLPGGIKYVVREVNPPGATDVRDRDGNANGNGPNQIAVNLALGASVSGRDFLDSRDATATVAVIGRLSAVHEPAGFVIQWETVSEVGSVAFTLYREDAGSAMLGRVTSEPIPAVDEPQGGVYRALDPNALPGTTCRYVVEESQIDGSVQRYGPFEVVLPALVGTVSVASLDGPASAAASPLPADWQRDGDLMLGAWPHAVDPLKTARGAARESEQANAVAEAATKAAGAAVAGSKAPLAELTSRMRIKVTSEGIKYLSAEAVASGLGSTVAEVRQAIASQQLELSCQGTAVAYVAATEGAGLYFHGRAYSSPYTVGNVYWLRPGAGVAVAPVTVGAAVGAPAGSFTDRVRCEEDNQAIPSVLAAAEDGLWVWGALLPAIPEFAARSVDADLPGLAVDGGQVTVTVRLHGGSDTAADLDHETAVEVNGTLLGSSRWDGLVPHEATFSLDAAGLRAGRNTIVVRALVPAESAGATSYLDWVEVTYPRRYAAAGNSLVFGAAAGASVAVDGFSAAAVLLFDVSDPARLAPVSGAVVSADGAGGYTLSFAAAAGASRYAGLLSGAAERLSGTLVQPSGLRSSTLAAAHVIIAPPELVAAAQALANYRSSQGLVSKVVSLTDVYNEFNEGLAEPMAVTAFLRWASANWAVPPRYVVLAGDGTYDYNNRNRKNDNLVPPLLTRTPFGLFASDNAFADVTGGDGLPDLAIGRLPVMTAAELSASVGKIVAYETAAPRSWAFDAVVAADRPDDGGDFTDEGSRLVAGPLNGLSVKRVFMADLSLAQGRELLLTSLRFGACFTSWTGHGGLDRLSRSGVLTTDDLTEMANGGRPTVLVAASCVIGRFEIPGYDCLAERLVTMPTGGAVAAWSPSALSYNDLSSALTQQLYAEFFAGARDRLGDAILATLRGYVPPSGGEAAELDPRAVYNLLGDPALQVHRKGQ